jgi:hypothetical protein
MMGLPVTFASQRERHRCVLDIAHELQQRLPGPARRRPARRAIAEPGDDARDPFTIEVLARDDDNPAPFEVDRARQDSAVPEGVNRMADRLRGVKMFEPGNPVPVSRAQRREEWIAESGDQGELRSLAPRGSPRRRFHLSCQFPVDSSKGSQPVNEADFLLNWELTTDNWKLTCLLHIPSYCGPPPPSGGTQVITPYGSMMSHVLQWTQLDALICSRFLPSPASTIS